MPNLETVLDANDDVTKAIASGTEVTAQEAEIVQLKHWIKQAADVCERASQGDLEARLLNVDVDGDLARMIHGINGLLDYTDAFVREAKAALSSAAEGKLFRRVLLRGMPGTFKSASQIINSATQDIADSAKEEMRRQQAAHEQANAERLQMADEFAAARAGEAGRGFAVVASEVKQLAEQTHSATQRVDSEISGIQDTTREAVDAIAEFRSTIGQLDEINQLVTQAVGEQSSATAEINTNVEEVSLKTEDVSNSIGRVLTIADDTSKAADDLVEASNDLAGQSETLTLAVEQFLAKIRESA